MPATIKYTNPSGQTVEVPLEGGVLTIGRDVECGLRIDDPNVSKRHAQVIRVEDDFIIRDQGSINGTYVGERKVTHHTLRDGEVIIIGRHELLFRVTGGEASPGGSLAVTAQGADSAGGGVAVVDAEPHAGSEWIEERMAEIGEREKAGRKRLSWVLNVLICFGAGLILLVLFVLRGLGNPPENYGTVELESGYAQLVAVPAPHYARDVQIDVDRPDVLEITEQDSSILQELRGLEPRQFHFIQVRPADEGAARITVRTRKREFYITVITSRGQPRENRYDDQYIAAESPDLPSGVKAGRAREWMKSARTHMRERPFEALEMLNVALAYAEHAGLNIETEFENLQGMAEDELKIQWKGLCLRYSQSGKRADLAARRSVLEAMMRLVPDKTDPRYQWAKLRLDAVKAAAARRRRGTSPWDR